MITKELQTPLLRASTGSRFSHSKELKKGMPVCGVQNDPHWTPAG